MEVGCEGSVALDLMKRMTSATHVAAGSTPIAEPGTSSAPPTPAGTVEGEDDNKKRKRNSAVKKQKQNGSQLEMIAEEDDPVAFLQAWVKASTDAQGVCTTVSAQQLGLCLIDSLYPCIYALFFLDAFVLHPGWSSWNPRLPWPNSSLTAPTTWGSRARSCSTWGHARQKMLWLKCSKAFQHGWLATANM